MTRRGFYLSLALLLAITWGFSFVIVLVLP
jgi:hypothetical protein